MPPEDLLSVVTAAVRGEDPPAADPPVAADPPAADPVAAAPVAAKPDLVGADPTADPPVAGAATPQMDADGRIRGPDGKFTAATPKAGDPPVAAAPVAAPVAAAAPVVTKVADPVNDPVPATAKPDTRERITTLAGMVKERDTKLEAATAELTTTRTDFDALMTPIREANVTFPQFQSTMELLKNINSPHQHEQMQALQMLQGVTTQLAQKLGQVPPGADPLTGQADLIQRVGAGTLTRADAEEIARSRRVTTATQQHQQLTTQQQHQATVQQQQIQQGQAAVREVEQTLEATDPQYKAKIATMQADTAFVAQLRGMPPVQWAAAFSQKYRSIQVAAPAPAPAPVAAAAPNAPQPLRAKQPAGGAAKAPSSMLEAVKGAIRKQA